MVVSRPSFKSSLSHVASSLQIMRQRKCAPWCRLVHCSPYQICSRNTNAAITTPGTQSQCGLRQGMPLRLCSLAGPICSPLSLLLSLLWRMRMSTSAYLEPDRRFPVAPCICNRWRLRLRVSCAGCMPAPSGQTKTSSASQLLPSSSLVLLRDDVPTAQLVSIKLGVRGRRPLVLALGAVATLGASQHSVAAAGARSSSVTPRCSALTLHATQQYENPSRRVREQVRQQSDSAALPSLACGLGFRKTTFAWLMIYAWTPVTSTCWLMSIARTTSQYTYRRIWMTWCPQCSCMQC
mmetsp:Transcript_19989/g.59367  ORF Transcript_19989/g.59367 Transcript_19989/m.59367 type:complete len:294 (+) Transcript_19989:1338-2219(+)